MSAQHIPDSHTVQPPHAVDCMDRNPQESWTCLAAPRPCFKLVELPQGVQWPLQMAYLPTCQLRQ